ncbi:MAG: winged helix-turn-helix domain-containing protein [Caldilineaceae bacterium]|nr:winged helix-turn-helix domain-containing protein [Caldilineaceae bacterium]
MPEIGPEHPTTFRHELVAPIFRKLRGRESCAVVGAASMGKSRLIHFVLRPDVQRHYLGEAYTQTLLACVDCNRLVSFTPWALHELILTALVEGCGEHPALADQRAQFNQLREQAIITRNELLAQRHVELALRMLCKEQSWQVGLLLDEFDAAYRTLPPQALASLRALRDMNKYQLSFVLFLRDQPMHIRPPDEAEGFYELVSRSVLGLQPYTEEDARRIATQILARRSHELPGVNQTVIPELLHLSGGHPGLLVALIDALVEDRPLGEPWPDWAARQPKIDEECRKLWEGLREEERQALYQVTHAMAPAQGERDSLLLKGLLKPTEGETPALFSPLFQRYAVARAPISAGGLHVDAASGMVWVNGQQTADLTDKEFQLLAFLFAREGEICTVEQLIEHLYPGQERFNVNDSAIAQLVKRIRDKIEPGATQYRHLLNVRGRGYRLVVDAP